jgi:hypothetical protein
MVAPSRELACRSRSSLVIPWPHGGRHSSGRLGARPALDGRLHIGRVGLAGREVTPIILCDSQAIISPYRIRCRKKPSPSRGRVKGKSLTRNRSTEHTIEKENPKHSPAFPGPKRMIPKSALGTSRYFVLVVLAVVVSAQARLQLLNRGGCHVKRRRPHRAPCPTVLALLAAALFLLRRRVPIRRGTPHSSPPATQRSAVAARQSSDSAEAVPREPVPVPPNDTMTLDVPTLARIQLGLPGFRRKRARDPRARA